MSQKQSKYITTSAFPEPNFTQTPNNFFDMLPEMEHSEVNVTLVMIRNTFGFHRTGFKMGLNKLADAAGLSRNAAKDGAEAAEKRGTFKRSNPESLGEAEWELVIGQSVTTLQPVEGDGQPVTTQWSTSDSQVGVKESIKEIKNKPDLIDHLLDMANFPGAKREVRVNSILSYFGQTFHLNTETKTWREFAKFVDDRQMNFSEDVKVFVSWLYGQKSFDLQFWPPSKMREFWPNAFVKDVSAIHEPTKLESWREEINLG